jgi:hypothetical protein
MFGSSYGFSVFCNVMKYRMSRKDRLSRKEWNDDLDVKDNSVILGENMFILLIWNIKFFFLWKWCKITIQWEPNLGIVGKPQFVYHLTKNQKITNLLIFNT